MNAHSPTSRLRVVAAAALAAGAIAASTLVVNRAEGAPPDPQPNVVFILTDDQAFHEMVAMPRVRSLIGAKGTTFTRAYVPYPLCCPSRAGLLSGQYMHNHGVRGNEKPYGGWRRFRPSEDTALPTRTEAAGYRNVHVGKYMNGYASGSVSDPHIPDGWHEWYGKVSETPLYYNFRLVEREEPMAEPEVRFYGDRASDYQTDVLRDIALGVIGKHDPTGPASDPFMLNLWFNAPHGPFIPAPRHLWDYAGAKLPRLGGFNERNMRDKPRWLRRQAGGRMRAGLKAALAGERRRRLEMLRSVDEAVGDVIAQLEAEEILDETYVIFASDNGFFRGEHRIAGGKYLPHEPSSRVPLMIRGPGIPEGGRSSELVSLLDIPQTIVDISTGAAAPELDGRTLLPFAENPSLRTTRPILLEADTGPGRGGAASSGARKAGVATLRGVRDLDQEPMATKTAANGNMAPAYRAIRSNRYLYVLYATGDQELYDLRADPAQLVSLHNRIRLRPIRRFLFSKLLSISRCDGAECRVRIGAEPKRLSKRAARKIRRARAARRQAARRAAARARR